MSSQLVQVSFWCVIPELMVSNCDAEVMASVPATEHVVPPQRSVHDCEVAETCHPGVGGVVVGEADGAVVGVGAEVGTGQSA